MGLLGKIDTVRDDTPLGPGKVLALPTLAWRHSGSKNVVLTQRVVRIQLRCPADHACDTLSAGGAWTVWADGFDALNFKVVALNGVNANPAVSADNPVFATFAVRDTTIATRDAGRNTRGHGHRAKVRARRSRTRKSSDPPSAAGGRSSGCVALSYY